MNRVGILSKVFGRRERRREEEIEEYMEAVSYTHLTLPTTERV